MHACICCVFVLWVVILNAFIGFGDIFCIYEHILNIFLHFLKNVQTCEQFSYELLFCEFLWFCVICCPPSHPRRQSRFPSGIFFYDSLWLLWKRLNNWKMILKWLRRVAFFEWDVAEASVGWVAHRQQLVQHYSTNAAHLSMSKVMFIYVFMYSTY